MTARTSYLLTRGTHVAQAAIYYPIQSVWADFGLSDGWLRGVHANALDVPGSWMTADKLEEGPAAVVTDSCYRNVIDGLREHNLDVDILDDDSIQKAEIKDGRLLVNAESFGVFVLPAVHSMQRATLAKLAEFWRQGGTLVALRNLPTASPEFGAEDPEIARLVAEIWSSKSSVNPSGSRAFLYAGGLEPELDAVMSHLEPNVTCQDHGIYSQQRHLPDLELYYLVSMRPEALTTTVSFRGLGLPELWNPQTGHIETLEVFSYQDSTTSVPVTFEPYGAVFLALRPGQADTRIAATNLNQAAVTFKEGSYEVTGIVIEAGVPWAEIESSSGIERLSGAQQAAPEILAADDTWDFSILPPPDDEFWHADMDQLELMVPPEGLPAQIKTGSWTAQGLQGFSGIGRYRQTIDIPDKWADKVVTLDLGKVKVAVRVVWDGQEVGERAWAPYTFSLGTVTPGKHLLEVEVANTLANYIAVRHADSRLQWAHFTTEQLESGLLGPVQFLAASRITLC
ncbi:MAG: glycosyl hydrolase [Anaerolineae bacterium]